MGTETYHPDVQRVVDELNSHRQRFVELCRSLSAEELAKPVPQSTWIVRDFIAHLATIDPTVAVIFRNIRDGTNERMPTSGGERFDIDRWNDAQVEARRDWPLEEVLEEAAKNREELLTVLASLTDEDLGKPFPFEGDSKRPPADITLLQYLRGWCKHDVMHAVDMLRALPERRTPEVEAWFDDRVVQGYQKAMNS